MIVKQTVKKIFQHLGYDLCRLRETGAEWLKRFFLMPIVS